MHNLTCYHNLCSLWKFLILYWKRTLVHFPTSSPKTEKKFLCSSENKFLLILAWLLIKRIAFVWYGWPTKGVYSRDQCQRSSPSRISDTARARFEHTQNLSSGLVECSCTKVITTTPQCFIKKCLKRKIKTFLYSRITTD